MEVVTISSKYQIVIPREVQKQFNLKPGQKIMLIPPNGTLLEEERAPDAMGNLVAWHDQWSQ